MERTIHPPHAAAAEAEGPGGCSAETTSESLEKAKDFQN